MKGTYSTPKDIAIFARLLQGGGANMRPSLARHVLSLGFSDEEQRRMSDLAARNQEGVLSAEERDELFGFVRAGHLLAALQSRARRTLAKKKVS